MEERLTINNFDVTDNLIKVIGVGGGGGNAVNNMLKKGVKGVHFVVCNTDAQDLDKSLVPTKIQLGESGLGAGSKAEKGREAAENSREKIEQLLSDGTRMVFITASMGGGTGTGAAPVIARIAKQKGILTVGIVTIPYQYELEQKIRQALAGVQQMQKCVDALIIINNQLITEIYKHTDLEQACEQADEISSNAAKSIAEIITIPGSFMNVDFADADTTLRDSSVAIMNSGQSQPGSGNRVKDALSDALLSPFTNLKGIGRAEHVLLYFYYPPQHRLTTEETEEVNRFMSVFTNEKASLIMGATCDEQLQDDSLKVTIIATGHELSELPGMVDYDLTDDVLYNKLHCALYGIEATKRGKMNLEDYLSGKTAPTVQPVVQAQPEENPAEEEEIVDLGEEDDNVDDLSDL